MARPNKPWYRASHDAWVCKIDGKQHTLAKGKKNKAEALKEFHRLMAGRGQEKPVASFPTKELCDRFLDHVHRHRKPLTYEWYKRHLKSFVAAHGAREASEVRPHHVATWADSHDWGPSNRRGAMTAVKAAFSWARKMGHIEADPIRDLERPSPVRRTKIMSHEQIDQAVDAVSERFALLLEFLRETGARPGEGAMVTAKDVDFEEGFVILEDHKTVGKIQEPRVIVLSDRALKILSEQAKEYPEGPLFRNNRGNPWTRNAMSLAFRRLRTKSGMGREATAQAIRHRFATDASKDHPNTMVAALLGHKSTAMADRVYIHLTDERKAMRDALKKTRPGKDEEP
jgi:integrase